MLPRMPKSYSGKSWDELVVGQEFWTGGRTVTEGDVLAFAGLTGDYNPLHVDEEFARTSPFKTRVPHGPLIHDMYLGLMDRLGLVAGTALAFLELRWKFLAPVLMGETVHARGTVRDHRGGKLCQQEGLEPTQGPPGSHSTRAPGNNRYFHVSHSERHLPSCASKCT